MEKTHLYLEGVRVTEKMLPLIRYVIVWCKFVVSPLVVCWLKGWGEQITHFFAWSLYTRPRSMCNPCPRFMPATT
jgi:hypothetical protein